MHWGAHGGQASAEREAAARQPKSGTTAGVRGLRALRWTVPVGMQLSLVYTLLFAATLALLGWALYAQLEGFLVQNTAQRIDRLTHPVLVRQFPRPDAGMPPGSGLPGDTGAVDQAAEYLVRNLSGSDVAVAVLDASGHVIATTDAQSAGGQLKVPDLPGDWAEKITAGTLTKAAQYIATPPGSERELVVLTPLRLSAYEEGYGTSSSAGTMLYLEQIISLGAADALLGQLKLYIFLGIIAGTVIGVIAGLALTRALLRPLDHMASTAEAIAGGALDRRLRLPPGRNEVARLGSAFDHMVERLGASLEAQKRFVADASHELRTPLTSLDGLSEMLLLGADSGDTRVVQRTVRSMHSELGRLSRLVSDLLTLSRLDSTATPKLAPVDLHPLLAEVAEQMGPVAETRGVSLSVRCGDLPEVYGERDKLKQVLINLVDNALRYTPEDGRVQLLAGLDPASGRVLVQVRDTGSGISPEDLPHIFDRFYRGDPSRTRATGNSGLGLAIARGIVEAHGGAITADSRPGEGTCFTITLPPLAAPAPAPHKHRLLGHREAREPARPPIPAGRS